MDVQYHNRNGLPTPGTAIDNNPNDSTPNYRIITGETTRPFMYGDYVCKFGRTTGYTCGIVLSTAHDIGSCCNATWMYVGSDNGIDLSQPGDSGAPWYSGSIAYGMHFDSAGSGGRDAIFWGIEFLPNDFDVITG